MPLLLAKFAYSLQGLVLDFACYLNNQMDNGRRIGIQTQVSKYQNSWASLIWVLETLEFQLSVFWSPFVLV